jgi:hypothetical protein
MMGGNDNYAALLDSLFRGKTEPTGRKQADITGLIGQYAHGNEPSHHKAYLYNFVGQAYKTQELIHQIMDELYHAAPDGLSGNEDCGQMSAWYVFSAMGFYPVTPASGTYIIGVPRFDKSTIQLENGKSFTVIADNFSADNPYVQELLLNGESYSYSYISHQSIAEGGELRFKMGPKPNVEWAAEAEFRPKSAVKTDNITVVPSIQADAKTFTENLKITLNHPDANAQVFYTLDGKNPTEKSNIYSKPFLLNESTEVKVMAKIGESQSAVISGNFYKIPAGRSITLGTEYSPQYPAGGNIALIDQQRGNTDFRTGSWQGYHGVDLVATVDLGKKQRINEVSVGFLQDIRSWIFMPLQVEVSISNDGKSYKKVGTLKNTLPENLEGSITKNFELKFPAEQVRFVKVIAQNRKTCPIGHLGEGEPAWIFTDEISIR